MIRGSIRLAVGILLLIAGLFILLQNLNILGGTIADVIWSLLLGAGSVMFLWIYSRSRSLWWSLIPGVVLGALAVTSLLQIFLPDIANAYGGLITLGGIGLAFFAVYITNNMNWWAVIPGGVMVTLGVMDLLDQTMGESDTAGFLFIGMGLTFLLLYFLPTPYGRVSWAVWPALALLIFGGVVGFGDSDLFNYIWPAVIILAGLAFLFGGKGPRRGSGNEVFTHHKKERPMPLFFVFNPHSGTISKPVPLHHLNPGLASRYRV